MQTLRRIYIALFTRWRWDGEHACYDLVGFFDLLSLASVWSNGVWATWRAYNGTVDAAASGYPDYFGRLSAPERIEAAKAEAIAWLVENGLP